MTVLIDEIRDNALLWLLALVPVVLTAQPLYPEAHTLLFVLSVLAIIPLAGLLRFRSRCSWPPSSCCSAT